MQHLRLTRAALLFLVFLPSCRASRILFTPLPAQVASIAGYASLWATGDQGAGRSNFSFLFHLPHQGRIEVFDFFGRALYLIVVNREGAFFILPSKKVFWQGLEEEILETFLGFRLDLEEVIFFLGGQGRQAGESSGPSVSLRDWRFEKDGQGRIIAGSREDLRFHVEEFIQGTALASSLAFEHPLNSGRVKIRRLGFNQAAQSRAFATDFLARFQRKTWAEISELLKDES